MLSARPIDEARLAAVPGHWKVVRLKHLARLQYGDSLPARARADGPIPVFGSNGVVGRHRVANTEGPAVIVGRKGSFGKVHLSPEPAFCIDTAFFVDRRHAPGVELRWLAWLLEGLRLDAVSQDTGVPGLSRDLAHGLYVPVPPPTEQRALADRLDADVGAIDRLIALRRARVEQLEALRAARVRAAVRGADRPGPRQDTDIGWIGDLPRGWRAQRLKWLARMSTGHTPPRGDAELWVDCDIPFASLADTRTLAAQDVITETEVKLSRAGLDASSARILPAGTVVLTRDASIGLAAIAGVDMAISQHLVGWTCGPALRNGWLLYALYTMRPELERRATGATIDTLGLPELRRLTIPLPPLAEQDRIVEALRIRVARIDRLLALTRRTIGTLRALRAGRIFGLTHGRLRLH